MILGGGVIGAAAAAVSSVFELDAGLLASYDGSSQIFANIATAPADGSAQTAYNFYRGASVGIDTDDPTFNGTAGMNSAAEFFSGDAADYFRIASSNTTFINSLHKEDAVFTWYGFLKMRTASGDQVLFGTNDQTASKIGIDLYITGTDLLFDVSNGTTLVNVATVASFAADTKYFIALSYNEATGAGIVYKRNVSGKVATTFSTTYNAAGLTPSASSASHALEIISSGTGSASGAGWKLWRCGMFNTALSEAALDTLYALYSFKLA